MEAINMKRPNFLCRTTAVLLSLGYLLLMTSVLLPMFLLSGCSAEPPSQKRTHRLSLSPATASNPFPTFTPGKITRTLQSWVIRQGSQARNARRIGRSTQSQGGSRVRPSSKNLFGNNSNNLDAVGWRHGSFLTLTRPTKARIFEWFGVEGDDSNQVLRCMLMQKNDRAFNHEAVGITNPVLHIRHKAHVAENGGNKDGLTLKAENEESSLLVRGAHSVNRQETLSTSMPVVAKRRPVWWPSLLVSPNASEVNESKLSRSRLPALLRRQQESRSMNNWRVLIYRKRVGTGKACYEQVRDAALDWEFQSEDGSMGMMEVPSTPPRGTRREQLIRKKKAAAVSSPLPKPFVPSATSRYSIRPVDMPLPAPISDEEDLASSGFHRSLGSSSRRLVTFTSTTLGGFLPPALRQKIYVINPVMVAYDVVDQRAPGTTFTSTAYATMKGHWLSGEERVTVAMRDGSQAVEVEILSVSRAGPSFWGKTVWPFVGKKQNQFFKYHLRHLEEAAATKKSAPRPRSLGNKTLDPSCIDVDALPHISSSESGVIEPSTLRRRGSYFFVRRRKPAAILDSPVLPKPDLPNLGANVDRFDGTPLASLGRPLQ